MHERTRSFIGVVAEQVKSASLHTDADPTGSRRLDAVIELSNVALSHLQFQDSLVQKLRSMNRDLDVLEDRVCRVLDGDVELAAATDDRSPGDVEPTPGEVMLF